jgi:predicted RNA-binding Zn-ribbon protein involved in translation (DUF1610 family)
MIFKGNAISINHMDFAHDCSSRNRDIAEETLWRSQFVEGEIPLSEDISTDYIEEMKSKGYVGLYLPDEDDADYSYYNHIVTMSQGDKEEMLKKAKAGSYYNGWRPYCLKCDFGGRMEERNYGFQCPKCGNTIGWNLHYIRIPEFKRTSKPNKDIQQFLAGIVAFTGYDIDAEIDRMATNNRKNKKEKPSQSVDEKISKLNAAEAKRLRKKNKTVSPKLDYQKYSFTLDEVLMFAYNKGENKIYSLSGSYCGEYCVWPDGNFCLKEDIEEYSWKSDDYVIIKVIEENPHSENCLELQ